MFVLLAGCTATTSPTATSTVEHTTADSHQPALSVTVGDPTPKGDITLQIHANTSLPHSDPPGNNPGEPYFTVSIDGETVATTDRVARDPTGEFSITLSGSTLADFEGEVPLTVTLVDEDTAFDDEIVSWQDSLTLPTTQTITGTATLTSTPTSTPTPTITTTALSQGGNLTVTVTDVVDGDTIDIRYQNGSTDTVRLLGVDTPEVHVETDPAEWEGVAVSEAGRECLATEGQDESAFVSSQLSDETVTIAFDAEADRRGSYDRLLAYVIHDNQNLNYQLVAQGYARVYDSQFTQRERFYAAEEDAQANQTGAWRCRAVAEPSPTDTVTDGATLTVADVHADAEGNDHENLNDEYVVFEHTGDESLDLTGWTVADAAGHTYTFPSGFTLDAGGQVTLHSGSGTDTATDLYWGADSAIWNNGGDTISVTDANGDKVIEHTYD